MGCIGSGAGGATAPGEGGATPIIVPFITGLAAGGRPLWPAGGLPAGPPPGRGTAAGALTINIVPLNLGAVAPLRLKPHFWHVAALSSFWVPQFGQNTDTYLRCDSNVVGGAEPSVHGLGAPTQGERLLHRKFHHLDARG